MSATDPWSLDPPRAARRIDQQDGEAGLTETVLDLINKAQRRVWLQVAWWSLDHHDGRSILQAVSDARTRGADVRIIMRNDATTLPTLRQARLKEIAVRVVRYQHSKELVVDDSALLHSMNFTPFEMNRNQQSGHLLEGEQAALMARGFLEQWDRADPDAVVRRESTPTHSLVPERVLGLLEHRDLNPFQADVIPTVLSTGGHCVVVAPTGAGKTVVGEVAALRAILLERRKAVWLVPARALAEEIGRLRARWSGLVKVEVLTGESNLSSRRIAEADLWLATTEKFEGLARRHSLRQALSDVGVIVVDEVHLIGDPTRGATLEGLLSRLRLLHDQTRIVALSATAANAKELADWLHADLLTSAWRPVMLFTQVVPYPVEPDSTWAQREQAKDDALTPIVDDIARAPEDPGSVLVFCGSKKAVARTARHLAGVPSTGSDEQDLEAARARGVGAYFKGLPTNGQVLADFRERRLRILVATSGLSTGVNTPARAVIVRDLQLGVSPLEVSQAQQMFGRAGRAGLEDVGHAFLLTPQYEAATWHEKLAAGYTVQSRLGAGLADALLAEILLRNVTSISSAREWYEGTFTRAQQHGSDALPPAVELLVAGGLVSAGDDALEATDLGKITSWLMVDVRSAAAMLKALRDTPTPTTADEAEDSVLETICAAARPLAQRPVNPRTWAPIIASPPAGPTVVEPDAGQGPAAVPSAAPTTLEDGKFTAFAAELALYQPSRLAASKIGQEMTVPLREAVDDLPRFLAWVAVTGQLGILSWQAVVAADLSQRLTFWRLQPSPVRGSGRLLAFLGKLFEPDERDARVKKLWPYAHDRFAVPADIPGEPNTPAVVAGAFAQHRADALTVSDVTAQFDGNLITVVPDIRGRARVAHVTVDTGTSTLTGSAASSEVALRAGTLHPGPGTLGIDIVWFSELGDYDARSLVLEVDPPEPHQPEPPAEGETVDGIDLARRYIRSQPGHVQVDRDARGLRRWLVRDRTRKVALAAEFLDPTSELAGVARLIAGPAPAPTAPWTIPTAVDSLSPNPAPFDVLRPPFTVLQHASANPRERAVVTAALLAGLGYPVGLADSDGAWLPLVRLHDTWHYIGQPASSGRVTVVTATAAVGHTVQGLPAQPPDSTEDAPSGPCSGRGRTSWLADFVGLG